MSIEMITLLLFGGLMALLILGVPVSFALGGITVVLTFILEGSNTLFIVATTTYKGLIAVPAMLKQSYNKSLALGSVMAGGVLGEIIPPQYYHDNFCIYRQGFNRKTFFSRRCTRASHCICICGVCHHQMQSPERLCTAA